MGGERKRFGPLIFEEVKKKKMKWQILDHVGLTHFIERLHGVHENVTNKFTIGLKDGKIQTGGKRVEIDEKLIDEFIGLSMEGAKFYRDKKMLLLKKFLEIKRIGKSSS